MVVNKDKTNPKDKDEDPDVHYDIFDSIEIRTWCPFCLARLRFRIPIGKRVETEYFCDDMCRRDYHILQDKNHPEFSDVVERRFRMGGVRRKRKRRKYYLAP